MKYNKSVFICFAFIISIANIFAMELTTNKILLPECIQNTQDALKVLKALKNPISKIKKYELIKKWYTGNRLLDKGFLQAYIQVKNITERDSYLQYKLLKYAITSFIEMQKLISARQDHILYFDPIMKTISYGIIKPEDRNSNSYKNYYFLNDFTYKSWQNIYTSIKKINQFSNIMLISELCIKLAFLLDLQSKNDMHYGINITWQDIQKLYLPLAPYDKQAAFSQSDDHNTHSFLECFTDNDGNPIDYTKIKSWCNKEENCIVLIFNTNPNKKACPTGFNTILYTITQQYCMLHFPIKPEKEAHNGALSSVTDYIFHDIDHFYLAVNNTIGKPTPTLGRIYFLTTSKKILKSLVKSYQANNNPNVKKDTLESIFCLFFILHEIEPNWQAYDNPEKRISFKKALDYYFFSKPFDPTLNFEQLIPKEEFADILFNLKDMKGLYESINEELKINNNDLPDHNEKTSYKGVYKIVAPVQNYMVYTFHEFYCKYTKNYGGTIPFLLSTPDEIKALTKLMDRC